MSIVSDRDAIFISHFWMFLFSLHGTEFKMYSVYHPQTNGQTEVVNRRWPILGLCVEKEKKNGVSGCL